MSDLIGHTLGQYEIVQEIGHGGMANVYRGIQASIGREVAVKVLPTHFLQDKTFLERFLHEVQVIARLQHPHILPVYDFGEQDGVPYIVMAYMPGGTLLDRIKEHRGGMPVGEVVRIVSQVSGALDTAHRQGIIHRDFKPSNILFDPHDNGYLCDFGIAKVVETTAQLTGSGVLGTPAYMAPELGEPGKVTSQVDVYALGVTVFEMLTGMAPYDADTPMRLLMMHMSQPIPEARALRDDLPDGCQYVIDRSMAKEPSYRYLTAGELAADLAAVAAGTWVEKEISLQTAPIGPGRADDEDRLGATTENLDVENVPAATLEVEDTLQSAPRRRRALPLLAGLGALLVVAAVVLVLLGVLPGREAAVPAAGEGATPLPPTDAPTSLPTVEDTSVSALEPTLVSLAPSVEPVAGTVELRSGGDSLFEILNSSVFISSGDTIRTGADGEALLTIASGVYIELYANTEVELNRVEVVDRHWQVDVNQVSGRAFHVVAPDGDIDYVAFTPKGVVHVTGTKYWIEEQDDGWCYVPDDGSILVDVGTDDEDAADDFLLHASAGAALLIHEDGSVGDCALIEPTPTDTPTPAIASGGGSPTDTPIDTPLPTATTQVDPCANNGGLQWEGDSCACSGVITHVIICQDGSKSDAPTEAECQPGPACNPASGGGGGGAQPGCGACGDGGYGQQIIDLFCSQCTSNNCCYKRQKLDACGNVCGFEIQSCC